MTSKTNKHRKTRNNKNRFGGACINNNNMIIDNPAAKSANANNPSALPPTSLPNNGTGYFNNPGVNSAAHLLGANLFKNAIYGSLNSVSHPDLPKDISIFNE
jgi:hypothetical protein